MTSLIFPGAPEIILLITGLVVLMIDAFCKGRSFLLFITSLVGLILATLPGAARLIALLSVQGTLPGISAYHDLLNWDALSQLLALAIYLMSFLTLIYSRSYMGARQLHHGEYHALLIFSTLGMSVLVAARHLLTVYLGLELMSLSLYAMVALQRDSILATEAAMKYFVLGALASGLLLFGISLIYGSTGELELTRVALHLHQTPSTQILLGMTFILVGIGFKLGVVPFHMWLPDVYQGSPTAITLFLSAGPKIAAFGMMVRILVQGMEGTMPYWHNILLVLAALSVFIGNVVAIAQTNIKRMLAYSAIAHMGYMLLGMVAGVYGDQRFFLSIAYSSSMFYILSYAFMSVATFGLLMALTRAGFEAEEIQDLRGLHQRNPWLAAAIAILMLSMAGIPFFLGFFAKLTVLQVLVMAGTNHAMPQLIYLAVWAVLCSLIGAFFYLRVIKVMYFDPAATTDATPSVTMDVKLMLALHIFLIALLGIFSQPLLQLCSLAVRKSFL